MARDLIEEDSDDDSSSDSSRSDTERRVSSNTTLTCAILPGFGTSNESKMKNSMIGAGGSAIASPSFYEHRDSPRLDIDRVPKEVQGLDHNSGRADDTCQKMGYIEDKAGSDGAKDNLVGDRSQKMNYNGNVAKISPWDGGVDEHGSSREATLNIYDSSYHR